MQRKRKQKLRVSDFFIIVLCLGICAWSLWLFWEDLNSSSTRTDIDKIATIHFKKNISQRKFNDRVIWERLQQDSELYNLDTIRTSDDAEAVIHFANGTKIDLSENTMIQILVEKDGTVNLSVGGGNIEVDTTATQTSSEGGGGGGVKLAMSDGSTVELEQGSFVTAASGEDGAASSVSVRDGNAVVSTLAGTSQIVSVGEAVSIEKDGEVTKQSITVTTIPKKLTAYKMSENTEPVKLSWKVAGQAASAIIVETASDKNFEKLISQKEGDAANFTSLNILPEQEKIFWRVYFKDDLSSAVQGEIKVIELKKIALTSPLDNSEFSYRKELPSVHFAWQDDAYAEYYRLEVSETPDFAAPVISEDLKATSFIASNLSKGSYYWRVRPYYPMKEIGFGNPSVTNSFVIEENLELHAPSLTLPANAAKIMLSENEQTVIFSWKSDVPGADYTIQLSDTPDFTVKQKAVKTSTTISGVKFNINTLPEGTYFWKVIRSSGEDTATQNENAESEIRSFVVEKYVPGLNKLTWPPDGYSIENEQLARLNFTWKIASEYKNEEVQSVIQFAESDSFNKLLMEKTLSDPEYKGASFPHGEYYWRVGILKDGEKTAFSEPYKITVVELMDSPEIILPKNNSKMVLDYTEPVSFEWMAVNGADYYKLEIFDEEGNAVKSEKVGFTKIRLELPLSDTYKKYTLSLQALSKESEVSTVRSGAASEVSFEVRYPSAAKLISPVNNAIFDGLTVLRSPIQFIWEAGDTPVRSSLTLQKQTATGSWKTVETIDNPKKTVTMNRLGDGRYRWYISASGEDGHILDSGTESFVINPIKALRIPELYEPANYLRMNAEYLKTHRSIFFSWSRVNGASDYDFAIYQVMNDGSYKKVYSQNGIRQTEVRIRDLSVFDVGTFEWRVIAYSHARDGYEEQKSEIASSRFIIDFGLPDKLDTKSPGTMYGE